MMLQHATVNAELVNTECSYGKYRVRFPQASGHDQSVPNLASCVLLISRVLLFKGTLFIEMILFIIFRERGKEEDRVRNINVWLPLACPLLGTWPTTQACALTGNPTGDPLVHRPALNLLSHTLQGKDTLFNIELIHSHGTQA